MLVSARRWLLVAVLLAPAGGRGLAAQQVTVPGRPFGSLRGTVFDSLSSQPLDRARVWIEGTARSVLTDGRGRFAFDSVPEGTRGILFEHPALDSIGFPQFGRRVAVSGGDATTTADLAVPSLATIYRTLCGSPPPSQARGADPVGVIFGSVSDAGNGTRLAGARVEVSWLQLTFERGAGRGRLIDMGRTALNARSDSLGNFYLCGVPTRQMVSLAAGTASSATGRLDVLVGPRRVTRQDLLIAVDTLTIGLDSSGKLIGTALVSGTVRTEGGQPLQGAYAGVDDASFEATSDASGRFLLRHLPAGSHMLTVRAIGYGAHRVPVELRAHDTLRVNAVLRGLTVLDTLTVSAPRSLLLGEMVDRLRRGWGNSVMGPTVRRAGQMATVVQQLPSVTVRDNGRDLAIISRIGGRECNAHIWIDGWRADAEQLRSMRPRDILAVEWYPRGTQVPLRYQPTALDHCGVLLVWTDALR